MAASGPAFPYLGNKALIDKSIPDNTPTCFHFNGTVMSWLEITIPTLVLLEMHSKCCEFSNQQRNALPAPINGRVSLNNIKGEKIPLSITAVDLTDNVRIIFAVTHTPTFKFYINFTKGTFQEHQNGELVVSGNISPFNTGMATSTTGKGK